jgi:hypothetical protein
LWDLITDRVSVIKFSVICVNNVISFYWVYNFVNLTLNPALGWGLRIEMKDRFLGDKTNTDNFYFIV